MSEFEVFYYCESLNESVESEHPISMNKNDLADACSKYLLANGDFFGVTDACGVTLQFMRTSADRIWMEVPSPERQGSYGKYTNQRNVDDLLNASTYSFEELKPELSFQSWQPGSTEPKIFAIEHADVEALAEGYGACIATDMITVGDRGVGFMLREESEFEEDSGWRFFSGLETNEYVEHDENLNVYDVNFIANYAPDIVPLLDSATGMAFERDSNGEWVETDDV